MVQAEGGTTQLLVKRNSAAGRPVPLGAIEEYAWPLRSEELLRAAGYDPEAMRWRIETGSPWRASIAQIIAVLLAATFGPVLALTIIAAIVRVVAILV
ncbi:hypothetical protein PCA20602_00882 [Pandoraea capi]|uniref:Uncharacterized protein n=1 Tax=Pandoraea capi TaxID=2508286 RepID=A0ABY6VQK6_9BURK|nr:hypothetical protein PCA20602_00882 [Pandoraea capi]